MGQQSKLIPVTAVSLKDGTTSTRHLSASYVMCARPLTTSEAADTNLSSGSAASAIYVVDRMAGRWNPEVIFVSDTSSEVSTLTSTMIPVTIETPDFTVDTTFFFADGFLTNETVADGTGSLLACDQGAKDLFGRGEIKVEETPAELAVLREALIPSGGGASGTTSSTGVSAIALTGRIHQWTSNLDNQAISLADGVEEQRITFVYLAEGASEDFGRIVPTSPPSSYAEIHVFDVGDVVEFL